MGMVLLLQAAGEAANGREREREFETSLKCKCRTTRTPLSKVPALGAHLRYKISLYGQ